MWHGNRNNVHAQGQAAERILGARDRQSPHWQHQSESLQNVRTETAADYCNRSNAMPDKSLGLPGSINCNLLQNKITTTKRSCNSKEKSLSVSAN